MKWMDVGIKTNFSTLQKGMPGIPLNDDMLNKIWMPDVYVYNLSSYKSFKNSMQMRSFLIVPENKGRILPTKNIETIRQIEKNGTHETHQNYSKGYVKLTLEATATIYCTFDIPAYPFDKEICQFRIGSRYFGGVFQLLDPKQQYHNEMSYKASDFFTTITFIDGKNGEIGVKISLSRDIQSFVLKYYVSCIAIVILSNFSFVIPLTDVSGRVALLVTLFLTLTNLFIYQMVSISIQQLI